MTTTTTKKKKRSKKPSTELALDAQRTIGAFTSEHAFEGAQRMAMALSKSSLVPEAYRDNVPNVLIALEVASRINASILMVMQHLNIVKGHPSWSATFLIATVNSSGRFSPLRFVFEGAQGSDEWGCRAIATRKSKDGSEPCIGSLVTIKLAKAEGWTSKSGSKWLTMPEQMLIYRAASFWVRAYAPELSLGMQTTDELVDVYGPAAVSPIGARMSGTTNEAATKSLEEELGAPAPAARYCPHDLIAADCPECRDALGRASS